MKTSADLQREVDAAFKECTPLILKGYYRLDTTINLPTSFHIIGGGPWNQIEAMIDGPVFFAQEPKDFRIDGVNLVNHIGSGWVFKSASSAGRGTIIQSRVQCKGTAWLCDAPNGADFSCMTFIGCDVRNADKGFKFVGSNNLDPNLINCTGAFCKTLFDFTEGGCRFNVQGGGGSNCATVVDINGGYEGAAENLDVELSGTVFNVSGATGTGLKLSVLDCRDTEVLLRSGQYNAFTELTVMKSAGRIVLTADKGYLKLGGCAQNLPVTKKPGMKVQ